MDLATSLETSTMGTMRLGSIVVVVVEVAVVGVDVGIVVAVVPLAFRREMQVSRLMNTF